MRIAEQLSALPRHYVRCLLADPPWNYESWSQAGWGRAAQHHYECMTLADIADLRIRDVCDSECWLFLWATTPCLPEALHVMKRWGFAYSGTAFVWAKTSKSGNAWHIGLGHTTRKNAELCLLGRRGKPSRNSRSVRELIVSPVREHSRKPDEQYDRIEEFCDGPRLELFARNHRPGWTSLGNEVGKY